MIGMKWIHLAKDMTTVINLQVPQNVKKLCTSCVTIASQAFCSVKNTQQTNLYHKSYHCGHYLEDGMKAATLEELTTGVSKRPVEGVR
jgi:hypothetical protein